MIELLAEMNKVARYCNRAVSQTNKLLPTLYAEKPVAASLYTFVVDF
ncbi:hypothetical protein [Neolewinella aurantiaca]|nr:hypothetical protein [Neolewinella aurantiaca]